MVVAHTLVGHGFLGVWASLRHAALVLLIPGGVCLFGCTAMLMRTDVAEGSRQPIPDDASADVFTKVGREIARSERRRVPLYQGSWQVLLAIALPLVATAGWAFIGSLIGPLPAIVVTIVLLWVVLVLGIRASQRSTKVQMPDGQSWVLVMVPRGVPVVSATNRDKSWLRTPILVVNHARQFYGEWTVSFELVEENGATSSSNAEVLSPRVEAAHRFRELARALKRGEFPSNVGES